MDLLQCPHTCSSGGRMSTRGSLRTKGCFSGCWSPQYCAALVCTRHTVRVAGVPRTLAASGEFGLRTSCPPEWTEDTRASHGVTVGHLRPTPGHNVITPNQEGFMDSSWAPGLSQTNQQSSLSLKKIVQKCFVQKFRGKPKTWRSLFILNAFSSVKKMLQF